MRKGIGKAIFTVCSSGDHIDQIEKCLAVMRLIYYEVI